MRAVIARFPDYEQSPAGLEALILSLKKDEGVTGAARTLNVSRSTISYWLKKMACFRNFAGQSPEEILSILADVAQGQDITAAAALIGVDPKTLLRSLNERLPVAA